MSVRIVFTMPGFFKLKMAELELGVGPVTGLVYFLRAGKVVAIAEQVKRK